MRFDAWIATNNQEDWVLYYHPLGLDIEPGAYGQSHLDGRSESGPLTAADGRPVHEIEVQLLQLQVLQGLVAGIPHPGMVLVEQLGRHPDVVPGDVARTKNLLESFAHCVLIAVC